jgi:coproporphyrinogen III oxidase-like Fe-S oxidoreductase
MQGFGGRIAGNDNIRIVAEPLQAAIPNVSMDIIIGARGQAKKFNVPCRCKDESNDDNAPGKS